MITVLQSLNGALHDLMATDARVVVIGEDILDPYGGAFKVTKGLSTRFPDRVLATPISESAIAGLSVGLAMRGLRPVAEMMFGDFLFLAGDQLVNHAAKFPWMYNDQVTVPMVVRAPMGARRGYGPTHSQSIEKHFLGVPGLLVVAPSVVSSPGDLLKYSVLECGQPVLFIENKTCYGRPLVPDIAGMTSSMIVDDAHPFPTVWLRHDGSDGADAVLWCYGGMVPHCLDAVATLRDGEGLLVDLAVVSQLSPVPASHVERIVRDSGTSVFAYAEEASTEHGWGAELLAQAAAHAGHASHVRIGGRAAPIPSSRAQEAAAVPQASDIVASLLEHF